MAQSLPRTRLNTSTLVRVLADLAVADPVENRQPFAERLGQWLDFSDSLALYSALNAGIPTVLPGLAADSVAVALRSELTRVAGGLTQAIAADGLSGSDKVRIALPCPLPNDSVESASDFAPYHRYYLSHQREMSHAVTTLRAKVRLVLSEQSAPLARVAALDAVLEQGLAARERTLLANLPALLARHFERLYQTHREALAADQADLPAQWMQPGAWLLRFCRDMQSVLRAELACRLQAVEGLIETLENEEHPTQ